MFGVVQRAAVTYKILGYRLTSSFALSISLKVLTFNMLGGEPPVGAEEDSTTLFWERGGSFEKPIRVRWLRGVGGVERGEACVEAVDR